MQPSRAILFAYIKAREDVHLGVYIFAVFHYDDMVRPSRT